MKITDKMRLDCNPFEGDRDVKIECSKIRFVKTRYKHPCMLGFHPYLPDNKPHDVPAGQKAWLETAKIDGRFGSVYVCIACIDKFLKFNR